MLIACWPMKGHVMTRLPLNTLTIFWNCIETGTKGYTDNNWIDMFMNKLAFQQSHTVSVRGGTDKVKYYVSFGYNGDNGLLKSGIQYYHRYNLRSNLTAELTKGLKLNVNLSGRGMKPKGRERILCGLLRL